MKKIISSILCLFIAVAVLLAYGCSGSGNDNSVTPENSSSGTSNENTSAEGSTGDISIEESSETIPVFDFENKTVTFLARGESGGNFANWDLEPNERNSSQLNAAIEERNKYIEDTYNVQLKVVYTGGPVNNGEMRQQIVKEQSAGTASYNAALLSIYDGLELAGDGLFYDLNELPYIDIEKPWWDKNAMDSLSLANRYYFGIGDISVQVYETLPCIVFNKGMLKNYTDENLYDVVENNQWTLDKFYSLARDVYQDVDGVDGPSVGDYFGVGGQNDNMWNFFYASGARTVELNKYGEPDLTIYNETNESIVDNIRKFMNDRKAFMNCNHYVSSPGYTSSPIEFVINGFKEQRILFYSDGLLHLSDFKDVDFDFGILPAPKYNEQQENYYSIIGVWGAVGLVIPTNCGNLEMTSLIMEAMAAKSKETVANEYYEKVLNIQSTRDEESEKTLKIILNSKGFDMGRCFNWGSLSNIVYNSVWNNEMTMASDYESQLSGIYADMNKTIQVYTDLPHYIPTEE